MTSDEVLELVRREISGDWTRTNSHPVDLRKCLVAPRLVKCKNTFPKLNKGKPLHVWIVLEEHPGSKDGYLIVFDESRGAFGLADWGAEGPTFLGYHGTFLNTLESM